MPQNEIGPATSKFNWPSSSVLSPVCAWRLRMIAYPNSNSTIIVSLTFSLPENIFQNSRSYRIAEFFSPAQNTYTLHACSTLDTVTVNHLFAY